MWFHELTSFAKWYFGKGIKIKNIFVSFALFLCIIVIIFSCINEKDKNNSNTQTLVSISEKPVCGEFKCTGKYTGVEFNNQIEKNDIAHQYSNIMSKAVGDQLKKLYQEEKYSKVDFDHIIMKTTGMGQNYVVYELEIPFKRVTNKCDAMTAFDHAGGWNHLPDLELRKNELLHGTKSTVIDKNLEISPLIKTPEGLYEYWIQWKHIDFQKSCIK